MESVHKHLSELSDEKNRLFTQKMIPGAGTVLGVKMPLLRAYAKQIAKTQEYRTFLDCGKYDSYEEVMLRGMVIQYAKMELMERLAYIRSQIPLIHNWALCDSMDYKYKPADLETVWVFIQPYLHSRREFEVRYGLIVILKNFCNEANAERVLAVIDSLSYEDYYEKMGAAWVIAEFFIKAREQTLAWLPQSHLDTFTYNKAIQKICESFRVSDEDKAFLRMTKR